MKNVFIAILMSFALLALPAITSAEAPAAPLSEALTNTQDPVAMLEGIIRLVVEQAPQLISQLFSLIISVVMACVGFVQIGIQLLLTPEGLPLLATLIMSGVMGAFHWGITGAIYGGILGLPFCLVGSLCATPLGAIAGAVLGFVYEALGVGRAQYPEPLENPYLENWKELVP